MSIHRKLMTVCAAVVLAFGLAACGSSDDDTADATPPVVVDPEPAPPTEAELAQAAAGDAVTAADAAAAAAMAAAEAAKTASANRATIQTVENSYESAHAAQMAADDAAAAAAAAKTASDAAAAAETVTAAVEARIMAVGAKDDAEAAQMAAEDALAEAEAQGAAEVKIVEKTKTVGETSITIDGDSVTNPATGQTTGLLVDTLMELSHTGGGDVDGSAAVPIPDSAPAANSLAATPIIADRKAVLGVTYDSADDDARLTLITSYLGVQTASVFKDSSTIEIMGTSANMADGVDHDGDGGTTPLVTVTLYHASGTYLGTDGNPSGEIAANENVLAATKASQQIYYYRTGAEDDARTKNVDESKGFLRRTGTVNNADGTTTYNYFPVVVVRGVKVPAKADFVHLHYGVWNSLKPETKTTPNTITDLGIGFVTAIGDGEGMTAADDMPQLGDASYSGNWVANIQAADVSGEGEIGREDGAATIEANFSKGEVDVTLSKLAGLTGTISGNTFSGTKADVIDTPVGGLGSGTFTGEFNGGFFGSKATEAGGVFDFGSKDNKQGAFRGSFGLAQDPDTTVD